MPHQPDPHTDKHIQIHPHAPDDLPYEAWMRLMMDFFRQGGDIARQWQRKLTPSHKGDKSIVTEADVEISTLAHQIFAPLKEQGHLVVEEESVSDLGAPTADLFAKHDFIWAIDPIDGTKAYTMHLPTYAISVGLLYKGTPLMGGVYLPKTDELFIHDGQKANLIENPFSTQTHTENLCVLKNLVGYMPFDIISKVYADRYDPKKLPCDLTASNAYATALAYVAAGRTCGSYFKLALWDMAGAWPLLACSGAQILRIKDGKSISEVTPDMLTQTWCFKDDYIACNPAFYESFKKAFKAR